MSFLQRLFGRRNVNNVAYADATANAVEPITHWSNVLDNVSIAANAVDKVAIACMGTNPVCKESDKIVETSATKLLGSPNNKVTGDELLYKMIEDFYLGGSTFLVLVGNVNRPAVEIHRIDPTKVATFTNSHGEVVRYTITLDDFQGHYELDAVSGRHLNRANDFVEFLCIKHPSGRSILNSCRDEIEVLSIGLNRNGALIKNGGRISMLLTFKDHVDQSELEARIQSVERAARSKGYGGFLGVTSGENGVELKEMGLTPKDMDFHQLQENCRREVYFRCGIPLPLVDNAAATDNNMAAAKIQLYTETVIPLCDLIYSRIGALLALREKRQYKTLTNQMLIPAMRDLLLSELERRKKVGVETINEMRSVAGLENIEGGDQVYIEARMVALGVSQNQLG